MQRAGVWGVGLMVAGLILASCGAPAGEPAGEEAVAGTAATEGDTVASVRAIHDTVTGFITATAEQVPENLYAFQPTEEVRTMGQLLGHIANASVLFCNGASGLETPELGDAEQLTSKADIQQALAAAFAYCDGAFAAIADGANEGVTFFGTDHTRIGVLAFSNAHNYEHYGNLVTYMRINGIVPPSSQ